MNARGVKCLHRLIVIINLPYTKGVIYVTILIK